jgi:glyoxylase-like metal-dependent hydrolase (beta-lactamase superfamily II)
MINLIDGVSRIEVPTPFPVGSVNCYLIEGSPLTLIDTGPKTSKSLAKIQQELKLLSYDMSDIEQILLTHSHIDHIGLVAQFARERAHIHGNPTEVWIHQRDADALIHYEQHMKFYIKSCINLIEACGVPKNETLTLFQENRTDLFKAIGESVPTARSFEDNASFNTGIGEVSAVWVPGHSSGSTCFVSDINKLIFSGDHLLEDISSNPSISFDIPGKIGMITYLESLDRISSKGDYIALPGHRKPILDIKARIETLRAEYADKLERAVDLLTHNYQSVYEISRIIYGNYDTTSLVLALAESYDLLRILESRNQANLIKKNGVVYVVKI